MEFMSQNIGDPVSRTKQKSSGTLLPQQDRFELRRLNGSYVAMVGALACRPEPRHLWDNVASPDRAKHPACVAVLAGKIAIRAAVGTGDRGVLEETARRVGRYFRECEQAALSEYLAIAGNAIPLADAIVRASKETTEALYAIQVASLSANASDGELTDREIDEAIQALTNLRASRVAAAHPINRRPALALQL